MTLFPSPKSLLASFGRLILAALVSMGAFGLFLLVREGVEDNKRGVTAFDHDLLYFFHAHQTPWLTEGATFLAFLGSPYAMITVTVLGIVTGFLVRRVRGAAWTLPVGVMGGGLLIQVVKVTFQRTRPTLFEPLLKETGYSFPSGHSLIAVVVYGLLGYFLMHLFAHRRIRLVIATLTAILIVLIEISRVYVGVHYPTDVLAGWLLGVPWLVGCLALHQHLAQRYTVAGKPMPTNSLTPPAAKDSS